MIGYLTTSDGEYYRLPTLLSWEFTYTGGVPCDSFTLRCTYEATMAAVLRKANRFTAKDGNTTAFYGVIDEVCASCGENGLTLELSGRGMAALLLDNESESITYQRAETAEVLRNHVSPYDISCAEADSIRADGIYKVASGTSQWKALSEFTRTYGGFLPFFSKDGTLYLQKKRAAQTAKIGSSTAVTELSYRDRRYGVISEAVVIDRLSKARQVVRNEELCTRGGLCRRIFYAPGHSSTQTMRYKGEYQIEQSKENAETLCVKIAGAFAAEPRQQVTVSDSRLGAAGSFCVKEVVRSMDERGETTEITMQKE